eukprot:506367-Pelagomonas_calceolata.AAC.1
MLLRLRSGMKCYEEKKIIPRYEVIVNLLYSQASSEDAIHFLQKQTTETYRFISDLMDIFFAVGTVKLTEQPNHLAEGQIPLMSNMFFSNSLIPMFVPFALNMLPCFLVLYLTLPRAWLLCTWQSPSTVKSLLLSEMQGLVAKQIGKMNGRASP